MNIERRGISLVLAVVAAVTLVALAARGDHGDRGSSALSFPATVTATTQAIVLIVLGLVAIGVCVLLLSSLPAPSGARSPRKPARMFLGAIVFVACIALFGWVRPHGEHAASDGGRGDAVAGGASGRAPADAPAEPAWGLGAVGVLGLLVACGALLWVRRDRSGPIGPRDDVVATAEERDDAVGRAIACADPRQAVLLAFAAAEAVLSIDPATRRPPSKSAREWARAIGLAPLAALVSRYELARFSEHEVTEADRATALDALAALT